MKSLTFELPQTEEAEERAELDLTRLGTPERHVQTSTERERERERERKNVLSTASDKRKKDDLTDASKGHRLSSEWVCQCNRTSDVRTHVCSPSLLV
jgi:hypothetical protein